MFKHLMEILQNHHMTILNGCFTRTFFSLRESTSIMSGNGKGFTIEEIFKIHSLSSD